MRSAGQDFPPQREAGDAGPARPATQRFLDKGAPRSFALRAKERDDQDDGVEDLPEACVRAASMAVWTAKELGVPYEQVELTHPEMKEPAYLAVNPNGKVPPSSTAM